MDQNQSPTGQVNLPVKADPHLASTQSASMVNATPVPGLDKREILAKSHSSAEDFRKFIEIEVLLIVRDLFEKQLITQERVQEISQMTLSLIKPGMNLEELYTNAVKLDDQYTELAPLVVKIMSEYEENYEKKALAQVSTMINAGKYQEAESMVKKVLLFKGMNG